MCDEEDNEEEIEDIDELLYQNATTQPTILNIDEDDESESVDHEDEEIDSKNRQLFPEVEIEEDIGVVATEDEVKVINEEIHEENHTDNDDVNAPTDNILEEKPEDIEPNNNNNNILEDEPENVEPINNNNNEPMSSIDELTINDAEIVPEIVRYKNEGRQGLRRSKRPVNIHRNMYERELSHANIKSGSERKPAWYNKKKRKLVKIRSDR